MSRVLIVHHKWDADVADPLAERLRLSGHSPVLLVAGERSVVTPQDDHAPLLVIWSGALAVDEAALHQVAKLSARRKPVLLRIDDTEPPPDVIDSASVVTMGAYQAFQTHEAVFEALALRGGRDLVRARVPLPRRLWEPSARVRAGLGLAGLALVVCVVALTFWNGRGQAASEGPAQSHSEPGRIDRILAQEAQAAIPSLLGSDDPLALRSALLALGATPESEPLRARLAVLEDAAWQEAEATADAAGRLLAIEDFRASFPGSPRMARVAEAAVREARDHILAAQRDLTALGFEAGPANGVMTPQTEAAVRSFQAEKALNPTGLVDAPLLRALQAARLASLETSAAFPADRAAARGVSQRDVSQRDVSQRDVSQRDAFQGSVHQNSRIQNHRSQNGRPPGVQSAPSLGQGAMARGAHGGSPDLGRDRRLSQGAMTPNRTNPPQALSLIQDCPACPSLVVLPQGRGQIGDTGTEGEPSERPARVVIMDYGLAMGRFEVTQSEWNACVSDGGCPQRGETRSAAAGRMPVTGVSHEDAKLYLAWLQRQTGHGYRLPSEAEWEFAAASDPSRDLCAFGNVADGASAFRDRDETCRDGFPAERAPVGQFRPNAYGLFDMRGNVWEWTEDCWHESYRGAPRSPAAWLRGCETRERVLRGGSYRTGPLHNRLSTRLPMESGMGPEDVGFRVVRPVADPERDPL
jgi:formylglycine-generating enzyme required for sulfatase activity